MQLQLQPPHLLTRPFHPTVLTLAAMWNSGAMRTVIAENKTMGPNR